MRPMTFNQIIPDFSVFETDNLAQTQPPPPTEVVIPANPSKKLEDDADQQGNDFDQLKPEENLAADREPVADRLEYVVSGEKSHQDRQDRSKNETFDKGDESDEGSNDEIGLHKVNHSRSHKYAAYVEKSYRVQWYRCKPSEDTFEAIYHIPRSHAIKYFNRKKLRIPVDINDSIERLPWLRRNNFW